MGQLMARQVAELSEGATALLTDVRFVPSVNALVRDKSTGTSEQSAALIAHVLGLGLWMMGVVMCGELLLLTSNNCVREIFSLVRTNGFILIKVANFLGV